MMTLQAKVAVGIYYVSLRNTVNGTGHLFGDNLRFSSMKSVGHLNDPKSWKSLSGKIVSGDVYPSLLIVFGIAVVVEGLYKMGFITAVITGFEDQKLVSGYNFVVGALADVFLNDGPFSSGPIMYVSLCLTKISFMALYAENRIMGEFLSLFSYQMVALTFIHYFENEWLPMAASISVFLLCFLVRQRAWSLLRPVSATVPVNQEEREE